MTYVMSDIHGNKRNFDSILEQIDLRPEDELYVLGDVIDRYPDGIKILRWLMKRSNTWVLLGNHEYMMLKALDTPYEGTKWQIKNSQERALYHWYHNGGDVTHKYLKHIRKETRNLVFDYLRSLPVNMEIEVNGRAFKLVHASPIENYGLHGRDYDNHYEFAVWHRWNECEPVPEGFTMIFGHTPTVDFQDDTVLRIWHSDEAIGIDCGSGYSEERNYWSYKGRLSCLRLDDMKEFYSFSPYVKE
jgi:serine/threonine protein phosphatase 1